MIIKNVINYETIDSTQKEIFRRIENNDIEDGTIIISEIQTNAVRNSWEKMVHR